jgi:hypothetical protein
VIHQGALRYAGFRYLWITVALIALSAALFVTQGGMIFARGDTWQGYTLGSIAALLIVWLALLGIRKRRYQSGMGSVQGWTSAHIYLGMAVVVIATLHCAAQFHGNIHTYAYLLMCGVVVSGIVGLLFYANVPRQQSANRSGIPRSELFGELFELDAQARDLANACEPDIASAVKSSIERTVVGGGALVQLMGIDHSLFENPAVITGDRTSSLSSNVDQRAVIACVANRVPRAYKESEAAGLRSLVVVLSRRQTILRRIRRDIQLQGWLRAWLYVHVPLTMATIAALIVHILSSFMYL